MPRKRYANPEEDKIEFYAQRRAFLPDTMLFAYTRDYRDTNFYETFLDYFEGYNKFHFDEFTHNEDFGTIPAIILYPLFLVADIYEQWIPYFKKEMAKPIYSPYDKLDRNTQLKSSQFLEFVVNENNEVIDRTAIIAKSIRNREEQGTLVDSYCPNKKKKATKSVAITSLRKYLFQNNFILKVNETGKNITFGKDINEALSIILPNIVSLKNNYVEIKGGYKVLEERLSQLIQEEVKIEVVENKVKGRVLEKPQTFKNDFINEMLKQEIIKDEENISGEMTKLVLKYSFLTLSLVGTILLLLSL